MKYIIISFELRYQRVINALEYRSSNPKPIPAIRNQLERECLSNGAVGEDISSGSLKWNI